MAQFNELMTLLTVHERRRFGLLASLMLMAAILDSIGVASIMPFMAVLANPDIVQENPKFLEIYRKIGFSNIHQFLFFLGLLTFVFFLLSLIVKGLVTYAQLRFAHMREFSISSRLITAYLDQPYIWFLSRNSADIGRTILSDVNLVVNGGLVPLMTIFSQGVTVVMLMTVILLVDPVLAISVGVGLGSLYLFVYRRAGSFLSRTGGEHVQANQKRFATVIEAFGALKEIKTKRLERKYAEKFSSSARSYAQNQIFSQAVSHLPKFMLEALAFGGILLVLLYYMMQNKGLADGLPIATLYAYAGYRLMPALQQIYSSFSNLRFVGPTLHNLKKDMESLEARKESYSDVGALKFRNEIELKNICFAYPNTKELVLKGINLTIPIRNTVGFIGSTGCGKTTLVDLMLGLLKPSAGVFRIDGNEITFGNLGQWQNLIGYVPQHIYLSDDTIAANIAFGKEPDERNQASVEEAARIACIHNFIVSELPEGYSTKVGERGVRLSGGQLQRVGIARALYHKPQVLILDEATSALDNVTEKVLMEAVEMLGHRITIILIAHRLSTLERCDQIYVLENGVVKASGTYDQLANTNELFSTQIKGS